MNSPMVRRRDLDFLRYQLLEVKRFFARERHGDHSRGTFDAAIETTYRAALEPFFRDNRLNPVHEGTNAIRAACRNYFGQELPKVHNRADLLQRQEAMPLTTIPDWL